MSSVLEHVSTVFTACEKTQRISLKVLLDARGLRREHLRAVVSFRRREVVITARVEETTSDAVIRRRIRQTISLPELTDPDEVSAVLSLKGYLILDLPQKLPPSDAPSLETGVSRTSSTDRLGDTVNSQSSKSTLRGDERRTKWWDLAETEAEEEMEQLKARLGRCTPRAMESAMTTVPVSSSPTSSAPSLTLQTSGSRNPSASTMSHLHGHRAIRDGDKLILTIPLGDHFTVDEIRVAETRNAVCVKASRQVRIPESGDNSGVSSRNSYSGAGCATPEAVGLAGPAAVIAGTGAGETAGRGRLGNLVRQQFYKEYEASDCLPRPETLSYTLTDGLLRIEVRVLSKDSV